MVPNTTEACFPAPILAINLFHLSDHVFYFTGSRWMGGARPESDWDFMTQSSLDMERYLHGLGFKPMDPAKAAEYRDGITTAVWQLEAPEGTVQVQLCTNVWRKYEVAQRIKAEHFETHLAMSKEERGRFWSQLYWESAFNELQEFDPDLVDEPLPF